MREQPQERPGFACPGSQGLLCDLPSVQSALAARLVTEDDEDTPLDLRLSGASLYRKNSL